MKTLIKRTKEIVKIESMKNFKKEYEIEEELLNSYSLKEGFSISKEVLENIGSVENGFIVLNKSYAITDLREITYISYNIFYQVLNSQVFRKKLKLSKSQVLKYIVFNRKRFYTHDLDYLVDYIIRDIYYKSIKNSDIKRVRHDIDRRSSSLLMILNQQCSTLEEKEKARAYVDRENTDSFLSIMSTVNKQNLSLILSKNDKIEETFYKDSCVFFKEYLNSFIKHM